MLRIADEKVDLAHQIYDHVDKHICALDKDLRNFDADLQKERTRLGLPVSSATALFSFYKTACKHIYRHTPGERGCLLYKIVMLGFILVTSLS